MAAVAVQAEEKAAAEASARAQEERQREAERRAALRERAESYKAQEASRLQVQPLSSAQQQTLVNCWLDLLSFSNPDKALSGSSRRT